MADTTLRCPRQWASSEWGVHPNAWLAELLVGAGGPLTLGQFPAPEGSGSKSNIVHDDLRQSSSFRWFDLGELLALSTMCPKNNTFRMAAPTLSRGSSRPSIITTSSPADLFSPANHLHSLTPAATRDSPPAALDAHPPSLRSPPTPTSGSRPMSPISPSASGEHSTP